MIKTKVKITGTVSSYIYTLITSQYISNIILYTSHTCIQSSTLTSITWQVFTQARISVMHINDQASDSCLGVLEDTSCDGLEATPWLVHQQVDPE